MSNRKELGSQSFGTKVIRTDEFALMAKVIKEQHPETTAAEIFITVNAMDDMLSLINMRSVITFNRFTKAGRLRKDRSLSSLIDGRMNVLLEELTDLQQDN